jgi:hypothetical protein
METISGDPLSGTVDPEFLFRDPTFIESLMRLLGQDVNLWHQSHRTPPPRTPSWMNEFRRIYPNDSRAIPPRQRNPLTGGPVLDMTGRRIQFNDRYRTIPPRTIDKPEDYYRL